jgi:uncharacterized protein (DUF433 family)
MPATELGAMIVQTPGVLGGKPRIKGHRIGVHRVAGWWKAGLSVEEIGERLSTLSPAEIHAALAYYHLTARRLSITSRLSGKRARAWKRDHLTFAGFIPNCFEKDATTPGSSSGNNQDMRTNAVI